VHNKKILNNQHEKKAFQKLWSSRYMNQLMLYAEIVSNNIYWDD
jgi:hypothetical protein